MQRKLILVPLLVVAMAGTFDMGGLAALGQSGITLLGATLRDPAALIAGRSPGSRGNNLIQTKPALSTAESARPQERVLDEVRRRPAGAISPPIPEPTDSIVIGPSQDDTLPVDLITGSASPNGIPALSDAQPLLPPVAGTVGGNPPAGGGGTGGGGGGISPPPATISPIPEPSAWIFMILGFWAVGLCLRREKRRSSVQA